MAPDFSLQRAQMIKEQLQPRGIRDQRVLDAMSEIQRHQFVTPKFTSSAYEDRPLPIGSGQTISQPYMVAAMTEWLELQGDEKILEIGTGSGYQSAILARLARQVISLERIPALAEIAIENLLALDISNVAIHVADGSLGWPAEQPYSAILVAAAAPQVPKALLDQLDQGGRLVIPVGSQGRQRLDRWRRDGNDFIHEKGSPVSFVPLIGRDAWKESD